VSFLLDTCYLSEFIKKQPSQKVVYWSEQQQEHTLYISVLTLGEIQQGITQMIRSKRKTALEKWLDEALLPRFEGRILDISRDVAITWGQVQGEARRQGRPLAVIDSLIAATALTHNLTIATRNVANMQGSGVKLVNPWE
jgi:predicted nucleic acid-binding protein